MSTPGKLKRTPQYNTTSQPTSQFDLLYPEHARMREHEEMEAKSEEEPDSSIKDRIVYYCGNCANTVKDVAQADKPCINCGGELVVSTL